MRKHRTKLPLRTWCHSIGQSPSHPEEPPIPHSQTTYTLSTHEHDQMQSARKGTWRDWNEVHDHSSSFPHPYTSVALRLDIR